MSRARQTTGGHVTFHLVRLAAILRRTRLLLNRRASSHCLPTNRVVGLSASHLDRVWATGPRPATGQRLSGHYLAWGRQGELNVLVAGGPGSSDRLLVLEPTSGRQRAEWELPTGIAYRSLAVGTSTAFVYLFGNRTEAPANAHPTRDAVVSVLDPSSGRVIRTWTARQADDQEWTVYQGAVSADEERMFLSYHGRDTTGIDWFTTDGETLTRCRPPARNGACIDSHGAFKPYGAGVLAATGGSTIRRLNLRGGMLESYDTELTGNHLMEFALDPNRNRLYAVGPCGYVGGMSSVDLRSGRVQQLAPRLPAARDPESELTNTGVCGERIAVLGQDRVVITKVANAALERESTGSVLMVDASTGTTMANHATAAPLDVLTKPE